MLTPKKRTCKTCQRLDYIFSKDQCKTCSMKNKGLQTRIGLKSTKGLKKGNRHSEANKKLREGYPEFFQYHIDIIKTKGLNCENCGDRLQGISGEVAHVLNKSQYPEVRIDNQNILYLCMWGNSCHSEFDSTHEARTKMKIYNKAKSIVKQLLPKIGRETSEIKKYLDEGN